MAGLIWKHRELPASCSFLVAPGELVNPETIIAELDYFPGVMRRVEAARMLGMSPQELVHNIGYAAGDRVSKGAVLATNSEFHCLSELLAPIDGHVALISKHQGCIYLRGLSQQATSNQRLVYRAADTPLNNREFVTDFLPTSAWLERSGHMYAAESRVVVMAGQRLFKSLDLVAPYTCYVTHISEKEGRIELAPLYHLSHLKANIAGLILELQGQSCLIVSYGYHFSGLVGYGEERSGAIKPLLAEQRDLEESDLEKTPADSLHGCIVIARRSADISVLRKLEEAQISGLVLGSLDPDLLSELSGQDSLRHLGQQMHLPYPIMLLQGYQGAMTETAYRNIEALHGRTALLDPSTQLRAGVVRPKLLVPLEEELELHRETILKSVRERDLAKGGVADAIE